MQLMKKNQGLALLEVMILVVVHWDYSKGPSGLDKKLFLVSTEL